MKHSSLNKDKDVCGMLFYSFLHSLSHTCMHTHTHIVYIYVYHKMLLPNWFYICRICEDFLYIETLCCLPCESIYHAYRFALFHCKAFVHWHVWCRFGQRKISSCATSAFSRCFRELLLRHQVAVLCLCNSTCHVNLVLETWQATQRHFCFLFLPLLNVSVSVPFELCCVIVNLQ